MSHENNNATNSAAEEASPASLSSILYGGPNSVFSKPISRHSPKDDTDTEALAGFLLSLKHRSVTPEPNPATAGLTRSLFSSSRETTPPQSPHVTAHPLTTVASSTATAATSSSSPPATPPQTTPSWEPLPPLEDAQQTSSQTTTETVPLESLIAASDLVCLEDRDLVPDALFAAMALMKPCRLQHADRVGCYKNRDLDFWGLCCKHCGGQPGFGRYFPNSVRSLAQTTTSQTILKHVGTKCRFTPPAVRNTILLLQREQAAREGRVHPTGGGRPRYGSRKIFFQRVWQRLHGEDEGGEHHHVPDTAKSASAAVSVVSSSSSSASSVHSDEDESRFDDPCGGGGKKRKETHHEDEHLHRSKQAKSNRNAHDDKVPTQVSTL